MAITYTWDIVQLDAYPIKNVLANCVFAAHWTLSGTDGTYIGSVYGSSNIILNQNGYYIPYEDLTKDQVVSWVKNALGEEEVTKYETNIEKKIADQVNPPVVTPPLPWVTN